MAHARRSVLAVLAAAVALAGSGRASAYRTLGPTFGTAMKACYRNGSSCSPWPMGKEVPVFEHTCVDDPGSLCVMQHFWSGGSWEGYANTRLRYYVDGESTASVSFPIGLGHGSSMQDDDAPWSAGGVFGKTGEPSGIFNTYAVPFRSVRVTVTLLGAGADAGGDSAQGGTAATQRFWIILRGRTLLAQPAAGDAVAASSRAPPPLQFTLPGSGTALPATARLRTQENVAVPLKPGDYLELVSSTSSAGTVFMAALQVDTPLGPTFLEGCFRATNPVNHSTRFLLSSGTEDFFLGTYYFNRGKYANPLAGLTQLNKTRGAAFSAYRLHSDDPIAWGAGGMRVTWRNGDPEGCDEGATPGAPPVTASSVTFFYEW